MSRSYPQNLWSVARVRGGFPFCDGAMSVTLNCAAAASGRCTRERQDRPGGTRAAEPSIDHTAQSVGPAFPDAQARGRSNRNGSIRWRPSSRRSARPVLIVVHDSQGGTEPPMHAAEASEEPGAPALCGAGPAQGTRAGRAGRDAPCLAQALAEVAADHAYGIERLGGRTCRAAGVLGQIEQNAGQMLERLRDIVPAGPAACGSGNSGGTHGRGPIRESALVAAL